MSDLAHRDVKPLNARVHVCKCCGSVFLTLLPKGLCAYCAQCGCALLLESCHPAAVAAREGRAPPSGTWLKWVAGADHR